MRIIIEGSAHEIAELAVALQARQNAVSLVVLRGGGSGQHDIVTQVDIVAR